MASHNSDPYADDASREKEEGQPEAPELSKTMTWRLYHMLGEFKEAVRNRRDNTDDEDERGIMTDVLIKAECLYDDIEPLM
jgi:hypothetical protein